MGKYNRPTLKEKLAHYTGVAKGEIPTKANSKFSVEEQKAYARGQRDARNESRRIWKSKHSTAAEKKAYREKKAAERAARKAAMQSAYVTLSRC